MISLGDVNRALKENGIDAVLVKGSGYYYFVGEAVKFASTSSVMVPHVSDLTVEQWLEEVREFISESDEYLD